MQNWKKAAILMAALGMCSVAMAATIRPGADPAAQRVRWADTFDWYNQWAYDNSSTWCDFRGDPSGTPGPSGGLHNGPFPPGAVGGTYPAKAPNQGCDTTQQVTPALHEMARAMWITTDLHKAYLGTAIPTPGGLFIDTGDFEARIDDHCNASGEIATTRGQLARASYTWGTGGSYDAMTMYQHNFKDRLQYIDPSKNAVNGTDANPLTLVFFFGAAASQPMLNNSFYVELSMDGDHAPTDYVWRGDATKTYPDPDGCPNGPFPVICQQKREINSSGSEDGGDLTWLNTNCPALSTKIWKSVAFGALGIMDKDPCGILEQGSDSHIPQVDHYAYFDGNLWRQLRGGRETGLTQMPPCWDYLAGSGGFANCPGVGTGLGGYDPNMIPGNSGTSGGFSYPANGGTVRVYIKLITDYMLIYVHSDNPAVDYGAAIPRVYKGGFNMVSIGVGPGCVLDPVTGECKDGETTHALTYSRQNGNGYLRTEIDSMSLYDGELMYMDTINGGCCTADGACNPMDELACANVGGKFAGVGISCELAPRCCPKLYADSDNDADLDDVDFAALQRCLNADGMTTGCECYDTNSDNKVNSTDLQKFIDCAAGPEIDLAILPGCTGLNW